MFTMQYVYIVYDPCAYFLYGGGQCNLCWSRMSDIAFLSRNHSGLTALCLALSRCLVYFMSPELHTKSR